MERTKMLYSFAIVQKTTRQRPYSMALLIVELLKTLSALFSICKQASSLVEINKATTQQSKPLKAHKNRMTTPKRASELQNRVVITITREI